MKELHSYNWKYIDMSYDLFRFIFCQKNFLLKLLIPAFDVAFKSISLCMLSKMQLSIKKVLPSFRVCRCEAGKDLIDEMDVHPTFS